MPRPRSLLVSLVAVAALLAPSLHPARPAPATAGPRLAAAQRPLDGPRSDGHEWAELTAAVWRQAAWYAAAAVPPVIVPTPAPKPARSRPAADPPPPAVTYDGDVAELIRSVFGFEGAVRVAHCESTLVPTARNGPNYGLFQISSVHADDWLTVIGRPFSSSWMDAAANTRFAKWLYEQSGGWGPWSCAWAARG